MFALVRQLDCLETVRLGGIYAAILAPVDANGWTRFCSVWDVSVEFYAWTVAKLLHQSEIVN